LGRPGPGRLLRLAAVVAEGEAGEEADGEGAGAEAEGGFAVHSWTSCGPAIAVGTQVGTSGGGSLGYQGHAITWAWFRSRWSCCGVAGEPSGFSGARRPPPREPRGRSAARRRPPRLLPATTLTAGNLGSGGVSRPGGTGDARWSSGPVPARPR